MARVQVFAQFAWVLLLLAVPVYAQPRPPRGGPGPGPGSGPGGELRGLGGERDPFFDAMREVFQDAPHKELFDLVNRSEVRQEIGLASDAASKVKDNVHDAMREVFSLRDKQERLTKDQYKEKIRNALTPFEKESYKILEEHGNFDRLLGIYAQARKYRAILNDKVAEKIGLDGVALDRFRRERAEYGRTLWEETRDLVDKAIRNNPPGAALRPAFGRLFQQAEEKLERRLAELLTDEQKRKFEDLKGVEFKLPPDVFDPRGRRPPHNDHKGPPDDKQKRNDAGGKGDDKEPENKCCDHRGNELLVCR